MPYDFNADEVFQLAIRFEQNGASFYRKAAKLQTDSAAAEMLNALASMEDHHREERRHIVQLNGFRKRMG